MVAPSGLLTPKRVIMGSTDAVAYVQQVAEEVMKPVLGKGVHVWLSSAPAGNSQCWVPEFKVLRVNYCRIKTSRRLEAGPFNFGYTIPKDHVHFLPHFVIQPEQGSSQFLQFESQWARFYLPMFKIKARIRVLARKRVQKPAASTLEDEVSY